MRRPATLRTLPRSVASGCDCSADGRAPPARPPRRNVWMPTSVKIPRSTLQPRGVARALALSLALALTSTLGAQGRTPVLAPASAPLAADARAYLGAALDSLQRLSRHARTMDWALVRDSAFALAAGARTPRETWGALQWALTRVDRHSDLLVPVPRFSREMVSGRVGYLRVPSFSGPATNSTLADSLQLAIAELERTGACGWIVDLRWNTGGNVWPMLAGIGPLLGDSVAAVHALPEGPTALLYRDGVSLQRETSGAEWIGTRVSVPPVVLRDRLAPVAVLVDSMTGSSGEAIALAFRGRPGARSFGTVTGGYATVNRNVRLADGVEMLVTVGVMGDPHGRPAEGGRLTPDEVVASPRQYLPRPSDPASARAAAWVLAQPACH